MSQLKLVHQHEVDMRSNLTGNEGEFNRSMQHRVEVYLQDFERLNSFANVDLKKTQPCLGLIEESQKGGSSLKNYGLNQLKKCCVDRLSRHR